MTVTIVAILQALTATAITPPVPVDSNTLLAVPSAAARALSVEGVGPLPVKPVTVAIQCLALPNGTLGDCIPAQDGGTRDVKAFVRRLYATIGAEPVDPLYRAALARRRFYRMHRAVPARAADLTDKVGAVPSVLIRIPVSSTDSGPDSAALGTIAPGDLKLDPNSVVDMANFYPPAARRAAAQARITVTCRVLADRSLLCRAPHAEPSSEGKAGLVPSGGNFDGDFGRATVQAFAAMRAQPRTVTGDDSIGRETKLTMTWQPG